MAINCSPRSLLLIATIIVRQRLELTALWLPVLLIPQLLFALGAAWLIASLGVFLRDIAQGITLLLMAWMYLTPIIYPESIVPERFRTFINLNPFTPLVRSYRRIFLEGAAPDWRGLAYFAAVACDLSSSVTGGSPAPAKASPTWFDAAYSTVAKLLEPIDSIVTDLRPQ